MKTLVLVEVALAACLGFVEPAFAAPLAMLHHAVAPALTHAHSFAHAAVSMAILTAGVGRMPMTENERRLGRYMRDDAGHGTGDGRRNLDPEQIANELRKSIDEKHRDVLKKADEALEEAKKSGALSAETKSSVDQALTGINVLREQLKEIEQKMARKPDGSTEVKSYGRQLVESDKFKAYQQSGFQGQARFELKSITLADVPAVSERDLDPPVGLPKRQLTIRNLLTVSPTSSASIDYARQTTRTNAAAPVAEGTTKPSSAYAWDIVNVPVRTIAHLAKVTRQALDDVQQLQGEIEQEMRYGLAIAEEDQELNGDGTGQNLTGLIPNATAFAAAFTLAAPTRIDIIRLAMLQAELALYPVDGHVLNPADWAEIELTKDSQSRYIFAQPQGLAGPTLWARPVVTTPAMAAGDWLTGGFKGQTLYDRMSPEVLISSENVDDFEKNLYTMRCEERLALAIKRPGALITGTFADAITAATAV